MNKKYEVHNQLTGLLEEAANFEEVKLLQARLRNDYIATHVDPLFKITVLVENEDGSWTQSLSDDTGNPVVNEETPTLGPLT